MMNGIQKSDAYITQSNNGSGSKKNHQHKINKCDQQYPIKERMHKDSNMKNLSARNDKKRITQHHSGKSESFLAAAGRAIMIQLQLRTLAKMKFRWETEYDKLTVIMEKKRLKNDPFQAIKKDIRIYLHWIKIYKLVLQKGQEIYTGMPAIQDEKYFEQIESALSKNLYGTEGSKIRRDLETYFETKFEFTNVQTDINILIDKVELSEEDSDTNSNILENTIDQSSPKDSCSESAASESDVQQQNLEKNTFIKDEDNYHTETAPEDDVQPRNISEAGIVNVVSGEPCENTVSTEKDIPAFALNKQHFVSGSVELYLGCVTLYHLRTRYARATNHGNSKFQALDLPPNLKCLLAHKKRLITFNGRAYKFKRPRIKLVYVPTLLCRVDELGDNIY